MEVKAGYKQTEVGVIPEEWEVRRLDELGHWMGGMTPSMQNMNYWQPGIMPWISSGDVKSVRLTSSAFSISEYAVKKRATPVLPIKTIIIVTRSGILRKYLPVAINMLPMAINQDIKALLPNSHILPEYMLHSLICNGDRILARCLKSGTTVESVEFPWLKAFMISVPPLDEQEAIAEALSDADALIESLEQLIAKKRQIKQGTMQELLTGKRRLPGFNTKPGYKQTVVGIIPEDWGIFPLSELGKFKNGINKASEAFGHGSPFVNLMDVFGVSNITSIDSFGLVDTTTAEQQTYDLRKGDVIFIRSSVKPSGVGLTAVVDEDLSKTVYSGFLIRFRDSGTLCHNFKRHCFYEEDFRNRVIGVSSVSANTNINQDSLKRLLLPLPPTKAEQEAIAAILSDMDTEIAALEEKLAKARKIKQGMMRELLTGRIRLV